MRITRDDEGLRFVGECDDRKGFVAGDVECLRCGRRIDPHAEGREIGLECAGCGTRVKIFWSEADMHVYLAENWNRLRQACTHPSITTVQSSK